MRTTTRLLLFFLYGTLFLTCARVWGQSGCTDPLAGNYDAMAVQNDGSCVYASTYYDPLLKTILPDTLDEISGIVYGGNRWWVHNDSGNDHVFYSIKPETGDILQTVKLKHANNDDWEDIAASSSHLYVGDIGNNNGTRTNLGVYKVKFSNIPTDSILTIDDSQWSFIPYAYDNQTDFSNQGENQTEFDCEAMLLFQSELHLFTKKWLTKTSTHYRINQTSGIAETIESFDVQGLITGADISPDKKTVVLLGYNTSGFPDVFVWLLWDFTGEHFFSGNKRRIELGTPLTLGKSEGIGFRDNCTGYITNEVLDYPPVHVAPAVRVFDFCQWIGETAATHDPASGAGFSAYPNPFSQIIHFQYFLNDRPAILRVFDAMGRSVLQSSFLPDHLDTADWLPGRYTFEIATSGRIYTVQAIKI
jgi:hypothetical protein